MMKSERKQKVQAAIRFFEAGDKWSPHGEILVEEVRRLRRELKKVNRVNASTRWRDNEIRRLTQEKETLAQAIEKLTQQVKPTN